MTHSPQHPRQRRAAESITLGENCATLIIWIDAGYDMVGVQERIKYDCASGFDFGPVDYVKYGEELGAMTLWQKWGPIKST